MTAIPDSKPVVHLITFGGGSADYRAAAKRVETQALEFPDIGTAKAYTDQNLPAEFYDTFGNVTQDHPKGFGLWLWKPFLILHALQRLNDNDILLYVDSGCEMNKYGSTRFSQYLSDASRHDALLFELGHKHWRWTKSHPSLTGNTAHRSRNQLVATGIFLKKTPENIAFVQAWLDLCCADDFAALQDPLPHEPQVEGFIAHRHDQSCLSATAFEFGLPVRPDETWFHNWRDAADYPILALRNRRGRSKLYKVFRFKNLREKLGLLKIKGRY